MSGLLDEDYFVWLCRQAGVVRRRARKDNWWKLMRLLHRKEFLWFVPNDDNRAADGKFLRREFLEETGADHDHFFLDINCSVLEMLVGVARRLEFMQEDDVTHWFWVLLGHLRLDSYNDSTKLPAEQIDDILDALIWRTYSPTGDGGLFPLKDPSVDQRGVEIWQQMSAFVIQEYMQNA